MQHCAGINALAVSQDQHFLWTASRDSTIKQWDVSEDEPRLMYDLQGHVDWVNDVALFQGDSQLLVSCSSDGTLRVWDVSEEHHTLSADSHREPPLGKTSTACLSGHRDYITSLSASNKHRIVASGGLGGEFFLWDLNRISPRSTPKTVAKTQVNDLSGSVYSVALDTEGQLAFCGTANGSIYLIDTRVAKAQLEFHGHTGNVRALCLRPDGRILVSGSADHTIRVWDLRNERSAQTLAVHTDSVWSLVPETDDFSSILSGGRDGHIYRTCLSSRQCECLVQESAPVTSFIPCTFGSQTDPENARVAFVGDTNENSANYRKSCLWVSTSASSVKRWKVSKSGTKTNHFSEEHLFAASDNDSSSQENKNREISTKKFIAGSLPTLRSRAVFANGEKHPLPEASSPEAIIHGESPVTKVSVLTNRRHVLTESADGDVLLWDLTQGQVVRDLGKTGLKIAEKELFDPAHCIYPWFQPDTRLGCLAGVMRFPDCFSAEAYRRDLGYLEAPPDAKVNMAEEMLKSLFSEWFERRREIEESQNAGVPAEGRIERMHLDCAFKLQDKSSVVVMVSGFPNNIGFQPWRKEVNKFEGTEREGVIIPEWIANCVMHGSYPAGKQLKMAFCLEPAAGSGLPALLQSRLNAPRVLTIDKVADYILRKMADQKVNLVEQPLFWCPEKQANWEATHGNGTTKGNVNFRMDKAGEYEKESSEKSIAGSKSYLDGLTAGIKYLRPIIGSSKQSDGNGASTIKNTENVNGKPPLLITCGSVAVPWDFTLAAVRQWMWKRSEDLKLEYGILKPGVPLQPPKIRPPS